MRNVEKWAADGAKIVSANRQITIKEMDTFERKWIKNGKANMIGLMWDIFCFGVKVGATQAAADKRRDSNHGKERF